MLKLKDKTFKNLVIAIFTIGFVLRLILFILNRSLWCDEALLSLNFLNHNFSELFKPLDNEQSSPILFLLIEKLMFVSFGKTDFALRIFPFIVSIICLALFFKVAIKILGNHFTTIIILTLFATSIFLLRYTLEVKQYQGDMLLSLLFLSLVVNTNNFSDNRSILTFFILGFVGIWFSNIAIILVFTTACYVLYKEFYTKREINKWWLFTFMGWAISFLLYFKLFIYNHPAEAFMKEFWHDYFPPINIFSKKFILWFFQSYKAIGFSLLPFVSKFNPLFYVFLIFIFIGIFDFYATNKKILFFLLFPLITHLILAFLNKYPVADKFLLYTFPMLFMLFAAGIKKSILFIKSKPSLQNFYLTSLLLLVIALVVGDLYKSYPFKQEEIKESISFIQNNTLQNETVLINTGGKDAFEFYKQTNVVKFTNNVQILAKHQTTQDYLIDINKQMGNDFWLLLTHFNLKIEAELINELQKNNQVIKSFKTSGSSAYLIRLK